MFEGPHALTTRPIRPTSPSFYREELIMPYTLRTFAELAKLIDAQDFDHVWTVTLDRRVEDVPNLYAPTVTNDPDGDIDIDSEDWHALIGKSGQYGYGGAVMHPSEFIGEYLAMDMAHMCDEAYEEGRKVAWSVVTVDDGDDEGPVGWVMVWRYV